MAIAAKARPGTRSVRSGLPAASGTDFTRPFLPEPLTPLFYTGIYNDLSGAERLRYNQLHGCYVNEQITFFEVMIGRIVLPHCMGPRLPEALNGGLRDFLEDERRHTEMFRDLNRRFAPEFYETSDSFFVAVGRPRARLLGAAAARPRLFPVFVWLMLLQEERSILYSREILRMKDELDPAFVETHRRHLVDEVHHVKWDEELLDRLWDGAPPLIRAFNARLFGWMTAEFFLAPKRAGVRVVEQLAREFGGLRERLPEMKRQLAALRGNRAYLASLYPRPLLPRTFARLDQWPELLAVSRILHDSYSTDERDGQAGV